MAFKNELMTEEEKKEFEEKKIGYTPGSGGIHGINKKSIPWWTVDRERNLKFFHTFYNREDPTDDFFALLTSESERPLYIEMRRTWEDEVRVWKLINIYLPDDLQKKANAMTEEEQTKYYRYWLDIMKEAITVRGVHEGHPEEDNTGYKVKFNF